MKKILLGVFFSILLAAAAAAFLAPRLVENIVKKSFPGSQVSVSAALEPFHRLFLNNLRIADETRDIRIKKVSIEFGFPDVLKKRVRKITAENAEIFLKTASHEIFGISGSAGAPPLIIEEVELRNASLQIRSSSLELDASASLRVRPEEHELLFLNLDISRLQASALVVEKFSVQVPENGKGGLSAQKIGFGKAVFKDWSGQAWHEDGTVWARFEVPAFGGGLEGKLAFLPWERLKYDVGLNAKSVRVERVLKELGMDEKARMTGDLHGGLELRGEGPRLLAFKGELASSKDGGDLVILDQKFLEDLAARTRQPIQIVEAGLKEYHYDSGSFALGLDEGTLTLDLRLNGPKGQRNLDLRLHDILGVEK